ncbi:hypothetical protein PC118_g808 [Phytophthora cactorum]|uniref:C3H1-type domain-containing protein n=1 Tax=Phytophthora cactorum TaxID=29920 RepID=A0A8T1A3X2_9STRA|nr:hypothetical protein PC111_g5637 [Phytophthora cactorum]KAG2869508.1 hypothetical protein PC113_g61 [Phytophthora cactorum]KAG2943243.1 hypothetical protein PC115_g982 [Phytophthora cactorum]KAG2999502.1 hypothetical protein PC118_g808 [Phytophthora cactorum]KAG3041801.1 hypothetical protein PC119_g506 [Phytophthora cactorum]
MERAPTTTTSSRPGTQQQPKPEKPNWRISFGFWTELDALYHSFVPPTKPRCPCLPRDSTSEWKKRLVPDDIEQFLGNPAAAASLRAITSRTETDTTSVFTNFIISGGRSTGKATFAGILRKTLLSVTSEQPCHFGSLNASEFADKALQGKLEEAVKRLGASKAGTPSFLIIERFESVTPSVQQHFLVPLLVEANLKKVFVILLVRPDANKLAEQIKTQAMKVHLHPLSANFVRTKLLLICQQERIGYTREGLEELAKDCSFKLVSCMEKLHEVFLKQYFISQANVMKICQPTFIGSSNSPAVPPFPLSILRMSEPLRRCPKCTLLPPCSHIPLQKLFSKIDQTRALYPENGRKLSTAIAVVSSDPDRADKIPSESKPQDTIERTICPSFRQRGICANVQKLGRCRYAHPLDLHEINTTALIQRCRAHTLPLLCMHCSNADQLKLDVRKEIATSEKLKRELLRSRQALADLETQRYVFARDRGKTAKWGSAKKAADEQLARMDAALNSAKGSIKSLEQELSSHHEALVKLQDAAAHGRSRGIGKGLGRIELKQEEKQRNKPAAV